ncbi:MAG: hypothetical protein JWN60_1385 [Acidobacteria bacterium]|jgi:hypothetical protein|nr:hypothetical protein [Acidobacteriota bacterium]
MYSSVPFAFNVSRENFNTLKLNKNILFNAEIGTVFRGLKSAISIRFAMEFTKKNGRLFLPLTNLLVKLILVKPDYSGESEKTIFYTGADRRGDQKFHSFNRTMFKAIETASLKVPLFNKPEVSRREFAGFWRVAEGKYIFDEVQNRMVWQFILQPGR